MTHAMTLTRPIDAGLSCLWIGQHFIDGNAALITHGDLFQAIEPSRWISPMWQEVKRRKAFADYNLETRLFGPFRKQSELEATMFVLAAISPPYCPIDEPGASNEARPVVMREIGRIYPSVGACAKAEGLDVSALRKHLKHKPSFRSVKGKRFVFYDELSTEDQATVDRMNATLEAMEE